MATQLDRWAEELKALQQRRYKATQDQLVEYYQSALDDLQKSLYGYTESYADLSFSQRMQVDREIENGQQIRQILDQLTGKTQDEVESYVGQQARDGYYGALYGIEGQAKVVVPVAGIDEDYVQQLVTQGVGSKKLSTRLYDHADNLADQAKQILLDSTRKGKGYAWGAQQMKNQTEANLYQSLRIARTEGGRTQSQAKQLAYERSEDMGINMTKRWMSTLDKKTRHDHQQLDGQEVPIKEFFTIRGYKAQGPRLFGVAREDINCRCTTITVVDGIAPDSRVDNETGSFQSYKNYGEWFDVRINRQQNERMLVGLTTKNGVVIDTVTEHTHVRMADRSIDAAGVKDALVNPLDIKPEKRDTKGNLSQVYVGERTTVTINPETGKIVTVYATSSKRAAKLKGARTNGN